MLSKLYIKIILGLTLLCTTAACTDSVDLPYNLQPDAPGTITIRLRNTIFSRSLQSDNSELSIDNLYVGLYDSDDNSKPAVAWFSYSNVRKSSETVVTIKLTEELIEKLFRNNPAGNCRVAVLANIIYPNSINDNASIDEIRQLAVTSPFDTDKVQQAFVMEGEGVLEYDEGTGDDQGKASGTVTLYRAAAKIRLNINFPQNVEIKDAAGNVVERWVPVTDENAVIALLNNGVKSSVAAPVGAEGEPWVPDADTEYYNSDLSKESSLRTFSTGGTSAYPYVMDVPFYTYPNFWSENAEETGKTTITLIVPWHKEGEPAGSNTTFYYQIPVTSEDVTSIDRNTSYKIDLTLGMLGSITPDTPVEVNSLSYTVVDWGSDEVETSIPRYRYLVVSANNYTVNNDNSISIPFYTTHKTIISDIEMVYQRFNYPADGSGEVVNITIPKSVIDRSTYRHTVNGVLKTDTICNYSIKRDLSGQMYVTIEHPMIMWIPQNSAGGEVPLTLQTTSVEEQMAKIYRYAYPTSNPEIAYSPYIIKITLQHEDNPLFHEEVTITQYPSMYIEAQMNEGGYYKQYNPSAEDDFSPSNVITENHGYAYLNPLRHDTPDGIVWQVSNLNYGTDLKVQSPKPTDSQFIEFLSSGLGGLRKWEQPSIGSGYVNNYNMYVINLTQLSESDGNYIIADTRAKFVNNDLYAEGVALQENTADAGAWCKPAEALYDGAQDRKLRYYYPTDESETAKWKIAPKLRVSSSFGYVTAQTQLCYKTLCRRRCATYQERGCPAGRWRLPTYGEVNFICKLSGEGKIPVLFRKGEVYMTAQGPYKVSESDGLLESTPTVKDISSNFRWSSINKKWAVASNAVGYNVRPVYDEWYWENEKEYVLETDQSGGYRYTLGDVPVKFN